MTITDLLADLVSTFRTLLGRILWYRWNLDRWWVERRFPLITIDKDPAYDNTRAFQERIRVYENVSFKQLPPGSYVVRGTLVSRGRRKLR